MNGGEGSSQGPQPSGGGLQPSGSNPDPGSGPNQSSATSDLNTQKDTDILANYLDICKDNGKRYLSETAIKLTKGYNGHAEYHENTSRIARYVHKYYPYTFNTGSPQSTMLDQELVASIRALNENVPITFR